MNLPNNPPEKKVIKRPPPVYNNLPSPIGLADELFNRKPERPANGKTYNSPYLFR